MHLTPDPPTCLLLLLELESTDLVSKTHTWKGHRREGEQGFEIINWEDAVAAAIATMVDAKFYFFGC